MTIAITVDDRHAGLPAPAVADLIPGRPSARRRVIIGALLDHLLLHDHGRCFAAAPFIALLAIAAGNHRPSLALLIHPLLALFATFAPSGAVGKLGPCSALGALRPLGPFSPLNAFKPLTAFSLLNSLCALRTVGARRAGLASLFIGQTITAREATVLRHRWHCNARRQQHRHDHSTHHLTPDRLSPL